MSEICNPEPGWDEQDDVFQMYIDDGEEALHRHPDYNSLTDYGDDADGIKTVAVDMIASILHAVFGRTPLRDCNVEAYSLLEQASRSFDGDYEDIGKRRLS